MLPFAIILTSTVFGLTGLPLWSAVACGLVLAAAATSERMELAGRAAKLGKAEALSLATGASLLIAQAASIGSFAAGRLLSGLLI